MRIEPDPMKKRYLKWISWIFIVTALVLIAQLYWVCEPQPRWKDAVSPQCTLTKQVVICQLVSDVLSDLILIFAPLSLIRDLQDVSLRRRLTLIFSTSIITTIVSLVHAALIFQDGQSKIVIAALVENTISLMVCNLPVVTAALFRLRVENDDIKPISSLRFNTGNHRFPTRRSNADDITTTTMTLDDVHSNDTKRKQAGSLQIDQHQ